MKNFKKINSTTIMLDNKKYKGYTVGDLPKRFAFIYNEDTYEQNERTRRNRTRYCGRH